MKKLNAYLLISITLFLFLNFNNKSEKSDLNISNSVSFEPLVVTCNSCPFEPDGVCYTCEYFYFANYCCDCPGASDQCWITPE